ncbi:unnamed protein product [Rotaria sp. Silwood2]|nr:unnamed protein product [Rotaria sp. Silwood2]CAF2988351.1 unnamed protein product [Rotaria sp. Silwood2]CAF3312225.1 unnamed protein product [Rotaria sp. Silwood2]
MNPFSTYRFINAEEIIKANIRPNHIPEDIKGLLDTLLPVTYITKSDLQRATSLHTNVIQKLDSKLHTLKLLQYFGYKLDQKGNYTYQPTDSHGEITHRQNATNEFKRFYNDLKRIKEGTFDGFTQYIKFRSQSPPLPNSSAVKEGNEKTSEKIKSFKESIVPRHGGRPAHNFIRRKLLLFLYKQKYPQSIEFGDELIDDEIDRLVRELKQKDESHDRSSGDEVYFECLIRTNFDKEAAVNILRHNRPNLKPPPQPEASREPTTTTIARSIRPLQQQWGLLNADAEENAAPQMLLHEGDVRINHFHRKGRGAISTEIGPIEF